MDSMIDGFLFVENIIKNMTYLEQYVNRVVNYTSEYHNPYSISYSPENIIGKCTKYPSYGDFPETYMLRCYGTWWKESEAFQHPYRLQDVDPLGAEDYITLSFKYAVVPREICIYETYNPGAIVRIWGKNARSCWKLLWEGPPQICPQEPRLFRPQIQKVNCLIEEIRLEFNQNHLRYFTAIDAVLLAGYQIREGLQYRLLEEDWLSKWNICEKLQSQSISNDLDGIDFFSTLPYEIIVQIFQYLDLKSLCRCAQVNQTWLEAALDPTLYQNLSLKTYWNHFDTATLHFLIKRCKGLKKIDFSWCSSNSKFFPGTFEEFLLKCGKQLTHLSLNYCSFVRSSKNMKFLYCHNLIDLRLKGCAIKSEYFSSLFYLQKLVTIDLSSTQVKDDAMILISKSNNNLKHIILDFCENILDLDRVIETVTKYNQNLTVWSSWNVKSLTPIGVGYFSKCSHLKELDLGWTLITVSPDNSLEKVANGCKNLSRLILSGWRAVSDIHLFPIIFNCKNLTQLDLLGIRSISSEICEQALNNLPNLRLLDVSFCGSISSEYVKYWKRDYPHVTIKMSCHRFL